MMKRLFYILISLVVSLGMMTSCSKTQRKSNRTDTASSGAIAFASDESFSSIVEECRQVFEFTKKGKAHLTPIYMSETEAIDRLVNDTMQLVIAARKFRQSELDTLLARTFKGVSFPIGYDGLALIINPQNTDSCITVNDVKRVLSGEVTDWAEINPGSKRGQIRLAFDQSGSSAAQYCVDSILDGKPLGKNATASHSTPELIEYVARTPSAIGIIGSNWLFDERDSTHTKWKKNVTVMSVTSMDKATEMNSWKPYQAYLLDGRYPFVRTIYALLNDPYNGLPWAFAHFMESPKGQLIIFKSGLLPVRGELNIRTVNVKN